MRDYTLLAGAPGAEPGNHLDDVTDSHFERDEAALLRLLRSARSGVPHDVAAAYATIAVRKPPLLDTIARERLALPAAERDAVLRFAERALAGEPFEPFESPPRALADSTAARRGEPVVLAEPLEPEPPGGVRARRPHFSASALNAYGECERKWFYRYVCAAVEDRGSAASTYGTAFHLALERFHERYVRPHHDEAAAMHRDLEREIQTAFTEHREGFPTAVEFELQLRRARRTGRRYVEWLIAESARAPFTVIGRELPAQLDLEGFSFIGFIDRLDRDERAGTVSVVDYKTGAIATSPGEYLEKIRTFGDFQLPFYYWVRTAAGDRVTRLVLLPLKDALLDVRPVCLEVVPVPAATTRRSAPVGTVTISELERAKARMIEICRELTSAIPREFAVAKNPQACVFCAYALACARRPPPDGERFGR